MTRILSALGCLLILAACGADGEPETPTRSGLSVSGTATIGIGGRL
ncbi:hypothetical protein [Frigidibacter sp. ROC022]|nr:hypothetical protein [Frigidibacter sp. ROC022]MCR8724903.1 hypothetical protein [Frigidibacter sp. ROC022]